MNQFKLCRPVVVGALLLSAACAVASAPSSRLGEAQRALEQAQRSGAGHSAAPLTRAARETLQEAERCERERAMTACEDIVYLALRRAQLAETQAALIKARDGERAARMAHARARDRS